MRRQLQISFDRSLPLGPPGNWIFLETPKVLCSLFLLSRDDSEEIQEEKGNKVKGVTGQKGSLHSRSLLKEGLPSICHPSTLQFLFPSVPLKGDFQDYLRTPRHHVFVPQDLSSRNTSHDNHLLHPLRGHVAYYPPKVRADTPRDIAVLYLPSFRLSSHEILRGAVRCV